MSTGEYAFENPDGTFTPIRGPVVIPGAGEKAVVPVNPADPLGPTKEISIDLQLEADFLAKATPEDLKRFKIVEIQPAEAPPPGVTVAAQPEIVVVKGKPKYQHVVEPMDVPTAEIEAVQVVEAKARAEAASFTFKDVSLSAEDVLKCLTERLVQRRELGVPDEEELITRLAPGDVRSLTRAQEAEIAKAAFDHLQACAKKEAAALEKVSKAQTAEEKIKAASRA